MNTIRIKKSTIMALVIEYFSVLNATKPKPKNDTTGYAIATNIIGCITYLIINVGPIIIKSNIDPQDIAKSKHPIGVSNNIR